MSHFSLVTGAEGRLAKLVAETRANIQARTKGKEVTMTAGRYKGRHAIIDGVILSDRCEWLFCCWILRADGSGLLDTGGDSRSYHAESDFALKKEANNDG